MITLKDLAKQLFEAFAERESGKSANWDYLNKSRKKWWIQDAYLAYDKVLLELEKDIKPPANIMSRHNTSYSMGYLAGLKDERTYYISKIQEYRQNLLSEYEECLREE